MMGWAILWFSAASASVPASASPAHPVIAVQEAWIQAYAAADEGAMRPILRDDVAVSESSGSVFSKGEVLKRAELPAVGLMMSVGDVRIREFGPVAIVTAAITEMRGSARTNFRVTETYVQSAGNWQLAASQWTRLVSKPVEITLEPAALDRLVGVYRTPRGVPLSVVRQGSRLAIAAGDAAPSQFVAVSPSQFSLPGGRVRWQFVTDPSGAVDQAVIVNQDNVTLVRRDSASPTGR